MCLPQYKFYGNNYYVNPTRCELFQRGPEPAAPVEALGCRGLDPCEVVFVKYGGEVYQVSVLEVPRICVCSIVRGHLCMHSSNQCDNRATYLRMHHISVSCDSV